MGETSVGQGAGRGGSFCLHQAGYQMQGRRLLAEDIKGLSASTVGKETVLS